MHINTTSGVNLNKYPSLKEPKGKIIFLFASRILKDKGIRELIEASIKLSKVSKKFQLIIAGKIDSENPSSISHEEIKSWSVYNHINYVGHINDMNSLYKKTHIAVLPSYREGLPKGLLEAAAHGKPIITTNVTGCRDVVINGKSGIVVEPKNSEELFIAMKKMIQNKKMRLRMGKEGKILIKNKFLIDNAIGNLLKLYKN